MKLARTTLAATAAAVTLAAAAAEAAPLVTYNFNDFTANVAPVVTSPDTADDPAVALAADLNGEMVGTGNVSALGGLREAAPVVNPASTTTFTTANLPGNFTVSAMTGGDGSPSLFLNIRTQGSGFPNINQTTLAGAITDGDYIEFGIASATDNFDVDSVSFDLAVSGGANTVDEVSLLSSVDGFASATASLGSLTRPIDFNNDGVFAGESFNLSGLTRFDDLSAVTFRLYLTASAATPATSARPSTTWSSTARWATWSSPSPRRRA